MLCFFFAPVHTKQCEQAHRFVLIFICKQSIAVYGEELTSYQTSLSSSGCFSACSAFQRETLLRLSVSAVFSQFSPPSLTNLPLWGTLQCNRAFCMQIMKENRLVFKQHWEAEGNDALEKAFIPATWQGCLGSYFTRKTFLNTAVPVFITALMPTALRSCFFTFFSQNPVRMKP